MKAISRLLLNCSNCGRQASLDGVSLESRLHVSLSISTVGQLYGKLRCTGCGSREIRISDEAGRLLVDPASLTLCRVCSCPIPLPRLKAMPGTDTCVPCAVEGAKPPPAPHYPQPPADKRQCPRCGSPTIVRQNNEDQGLFLGCTGFPKCRGPNASADKRFESHKRATRRLQQQYRRENLGKEGRLRARAQSARAILQIRRLPPSRDCTACPVESRCELLFA
jgi:DNA-directed RNA polymerase subunit RPC12/RpoP